jgi:hypothetical protein
MIREGRVVLTSAEAAEDGPREVVLGKLATLAVPPGHLRESASYTISADGLVLDYRVVDRKVYEPA